MDDESKAYLCYPRMSSGTTVVIDSPKEYEIDKEIAGFNRTIESDSMNRTSLIDVLEIRGNISFIAPVDSANNHHYKLWNATSYIYTGSCDACWVDTGYGDELKQIDVYSEDIFGQNRTFLIFVNFFNTLYQHFSDNLVGNMVILKLLNESLLVDYADSMIMIPEKTVISELLALLLSKETKLASRVLYYPVGKKIYFENSKVGVITFRPRWIGFHKPHFLSRNPSAIAFGRFMVSKLLSRQPCGRKKIVYVSRSEKLANGRAVGNENNTISVIRDKMLQFGRQEELDIFVSPGSYLEQINFFRCAKMIIGAHGGGMSNVFWTEPSQNCSDPVEVIESICGSRSWRVQGNCPYSRTFFNILGGVPWVKYSVLVFTSQSIAPITFIPIDALAFRLDTLWGPPQRASSFLQGQAAQQNQRYSSCRNGTAGAESTSSMCSKTQIIFDY